MTQSPAAIQISIALEKSQANAVDFLVVRRRACVKSPAGSGKTIMAAAAVKRVVESRQRTTPVRMGWACGTVEQGQQGWLALLQIFAGLTCAKHLAEELFMHWLSQNQHTKIRPLISCVAGFSHSDLDVLIVDECHHVEDALTWQEMIKGHKGALWGFSATIPVERTGEKFWPFGETYVVPRSAVANRVVNARVVILNASDPNSKELINQNAEAAYYKAIHWSLIAEKNLRVLGDVKNHEKEIKSAKCVFSKRFDGWFARNEEFWRELCALCGSPAPDQLPTPFPRPKPAGDIWRKLLWVACNEHGISKNTFRNAEVIRVACENTQSGRHILILAAKVEQAKELADAIPGALAVYAAIGRTPRRLAMERFASGDLLCMVATTLADEGLDLPIADTLIYTSGGSSANKVEQRAGRVTRTHPGKTSALIYDFSDVNVHPMMKSHADARLRIYRQLGYSIEGDLNLFSGQPNLGL